MFIKAFTPRMSEVVGGRHVRHDVVTIWLVEGFAGISEMFGPDIWDSGLIMANLNVDYLNEIIWGQDVEVTTAVKSVGSSSFVLLQNVLQNSRPCARALVTLIHYNYLTHESQSIPQDIRLQLEQHLIKE
jgi:acyl-CoA thioester hydrolase